jgi:hypothetical protein
MAMSVGNFATQNPMKYEFDVLVDLGKAISGVGAVVNGINSTLSTYGISERASVWGTMGSITIDSPTPLTKEQLITMRDEMQERCKAATPSLSIQVGNARCKSSQSGSQSTDE